MVISDRIQPCPAGCRGVHSYTADSRRVCWRTSHQRAAIDVELLAQPLPETLSRTWTGTSHEFWRAWTAAEVAAKLAEVPILLWLRDHPLGSPVPADVVMTHHERDGLVVCLGWASTR